LEGSKIPPYTLSEFLDLKFWNYKQLVSRIDSSDYQWLPVEQAVVQITLANGRIVRDFRFLNTVQGQRTLRWVKTQRMTLTGPIYGPAVEDLPDHALTGVAAAVAAGHIEVAVPEARALVVPGDGFPVQVMVFYWTQTFLITIIRKTEEEKIFLRILREIGLIRAEMIVRRDARRAARALVVVAPVVAEQDE